MKNLCLILLVLLLPTRVRAEEPDRIIFPHDLHFEEELDCDACHDGAATSTMATDYLLPDMDACSDCHDVDDEDECAMCHTNADEAGEYDRPVYGANLFAHAAHLVGELDCASCHGKPTAAQPTVPGKPDCRVCHETAEEYADCRLCHAAAQNLLPVNHTTTWSNSHGLCARENPDQCWQCHTETSCQDCHAGDNVRPRSHRLNYAFDHALDARGNQMQCATCHLEPTYCSNCHIAERVLPQDHSQVGWVRNNGGGYHATEGLFNLESCIACHDTGAEEPTCARCHGGG